MEQKFFYVTTLDGKTHFCKEIINKDKTQPKREFITPQNISIFCVSPTDNVNDYLKYGYCYTKEEYIKLIEQDITYLDIFFRTEKMEYLLGELQNIVYNN